MLTSLARPRLYAILIGGYAALALVIAAVGLFGVLSYAVAQSGARAGRSHGARSARNRHHPARGRSGPDGRHRRPGHRPRGAFVVTRALGALLYGVSRYDAATYVVVPVILLLAAAAACVVPARRAAARLDPLRRALAEARLECLRANAEAAAIRGHLGRLR